MTELMAQLVSRASLSEAQARQAAEVVRAFLAERLPESLRAPVEAALTGAKVESAFNQVVKGIAGKLF